MLVANIGGRRPDLGFARRRFQWRWSSGLCLVQFRHWPNANRLFVGTNSHWSRIRTNHSPHVAVRWLQPILMETEIRITYSITSPVVKPQSSTLNNTVVVNAALGPIFTRWMETARAWARG